MAQVDKIDSNVTDLRYREETSPGVVDSGVWTGMEPNSYSNFGATLTLLARESLSATRQRKKGVVVDLEAAGAFNTDLTQTNLTDILQGFFCAALRKKDETACATVTGGATDDFTVANPLGSEYVSGDLLFASGFDDAANNGLHQVNGSAGTTVSVTSNLVDAAAQSGILRRVGYVFAAGDLEMVVSGTLPTLVTATKDFTQLGLVPGEWIFIGGDSASDRFFNSENNGFARVRSVAANALELDKMQDTAVADDGTDTGAGGANLALKIFFAPRILKDESDPTLVIEKTYQLERSLGVPDDASPAQIQSEYLIGAYGNECTFNFGTADKVTCDLSFLALDHETYTGAEGRKAGTRPAVEDANAFNTNSTVTFAKLALVSSSDENVSELFAGIEEVKLTINNNLQANKALGVTGAFCVSKGFFSVSGTIQAYFNNVEAIRSVIDNEDVTFHYHLVRDNAGISFDLPLIALGDGSPTVEVNNPVKIPLTFEASSGAQAFEDYDHTLMLCFWDYLPTAAAG
jgi:hypothetical protein